MSDGNQPFISAVRERRQHARARARTHPHPCPHPHPSRELIPVVSREEWSIEADMIQLLLQCELWSDVS